MEKRPLIYLAGPMSGISELNYPAFEKKAQELREQGFRVCSPVEVNNCREINPKDSAYASMGLKMTALQDISLVAGCDGLYMMDGTLDPVLLNALLLSPHSRGGMAEAMFARWIQLPIIHEQMANDELTMQQFKDDTTNLKEN